MKEAIFVKSHNMKKIYWILIILVIAILLGTGFFLYEWNRPNKSTSELETAYALSAESLTAVFMLCKLVFYHADDDRIRH